MARMQKTKTILKTKRNDGLELALDYRDYYRYRRLVNHPGRATEAYFSDKIAAAVFAVFNLDT